MKMDTGLLFTFFQRVKPSACDASLSESSQVDSNQRGNVFFFYLNGSYCMQGCSGTGWHGKLEICRKAVQGYFRQKACFPFYSL